MEQIKWHLRAGQKCGRMAARHAGAGFECFEVNFHMSYEGYDLPKLAETRQAHCGRPPGERGHTGVLLQPHPEPGSL